MKRVKPEVRRSETVRDCVTVHLPMPPSVNALFVNVPGRGRVLSKRYAAWRKDAGWILQQQRPGIFDGCVSVEIHLQEKGRRDGDNFTKALLDLCVTHGVIQDDSNKFVRSVSTSWADIEGARITIRRAQ